MIKARRTAGTAQLKTNGGKAKAAAAAKKNQKAAQKSVGINKAKRNAKNAARRGIASSDKPSPMDIEREVFRQQRYAGGAGAGSRTRNNTNPRRSNRILNVRSEAEKKAKTRNLGGVLKKRGGGVRKNEELRNNNKNQNSNGNNNSTNNRQQKGNRNEDSIKAPPRKAVNAAMKAMNTAGFVAPQGMKMVISFAPVVSNKKKTNKKQTDNPRGRRNNN